ncbi:hypothetical protein [Flavobacterium sp. HTF]|uniref:hypothetical protein n=1 Tax=Flavobacterium sp. HTF TaxID=2170732 RepID=UPI000D5C4346|nr:hypothetical protein [Flavobacterium sp. HTF]PWB23890.1 hypothetical protein DCO46_13220 [Flavobacterium sp. HTF]
MEILLEKFKLFIKSVPKEIKEEEKIVKVIFNPLNINTKGIKSNAYRARKDDLSVNRLKYTTLNYCKRQGVRLDKESKKAKKGEKPFKDKNFYGIALLFANEIRSLAQVLYKPVIWPPKDFNKAHAEIKIGHSTLTGAGEVSNARYLYVTDELARMSRLYIDEKHNEKIWVSDNSREILNLRK